MYKEQIRELENEIKLRQKAVRKAPSGEISLSKSNGYVQFRVRRNCDEENANNISCRKYISKRETDLIERLIQKKFDQRYILNAKEEIRTLQHAEQMGLELTPDHINHICKYIAHKTYMQMNVNYRKYIFEIESDEEYLNNWKNESFETNQMSFGDTNLVSLSGVRVRSKSELEICNILDSLKLPYRYEARLEFSNGYCCYPDFTILDISSRRVIYWEHFGMCDSPDYATNAMMKLLRYSLCGIRGDTNLITTFESSKVPINTEYIREMLISYFDLKE